MTVKIKYTISIGTAVLIVPTFRCGGSNCRLGLVVGRIMITKSDLQKLNDLIASGNEHRFYLWTKWKHLAKYVREEIDHGECQMCKAEGKSGTKNGVLIVHHVKHLKERPDLALSLHDPETGERQLVTLCKRHHEEMHPESMRQNANAAKVEKYDEYW